MKRQLLLSAALLTAAVAGAQHVALRIGEMPATVGAPRIPVVLVQFQDVAMSEASPKAAYESRLAGEATPEQVERGEGTAARYFADQSFGRFTPEFVVTGPVTLDHERAYYGADGIGGTDPNVGLMIAEAIQKVAQSGEVDDWNDFDSNADGVVDALYVIYAGEGQHAIPSQTDLIWPHTSTLAGHGYESPVVDGLTFNSYSCTNELLYGKVDGIGTFCHEFAHQLGLPDFYRTDGKTEANFNMGDWSLMDRGGYELDGRRPVAMRALERIAMGWIEPLELTEPVTVKDWPSMAQGGRPLKIVNDAHPEEYYLLETIDGRGWDASCPAGGLLVTHVSLTAEIPTQASEWVGNTVNNGALQCVRIVPADNERPLLVTGVNDEEYEENLKGDTYPSPQGNDELTDTSTPSFGCLYGTGWVPTIGKPLTDITYDAAAGRVSLRFMSGSEEHVITGIARPQTGAALQSAGYYRLDGTAVQEPLQPGVYVRVREDGSVEKFLQR